MESLQNHLLLGAEESRDSIAHPIQQEFDDYYPLLSESIHFTTMYRDFGVLHQVFLIG